jgi:putative YhbY family RNA-binding protein
MVKASNSGTAPSAPVSAQSLRALRARAHTLKPVVRIGQPGVTEGVRRELDRALTAHELVKIHAAIDDREERARLLHALCEALDAVAVQAIGKVLVAFRPKPQAEPKREVAPAAARARPKKRASRARARPVGTKGFKRPTSRARSPARRT